MKRRVHKCCSFYEHTCLLWPCKGSSFMSWHHVASKTPSVYASSHLHTPNCTQIVFQTAFLSKQYSLCSQQGVVLRFSLSSYSFSSWQLMLQVLMSLKKLRMSHNFPGFLLRPSIFCGLLFWVLCCKCDCEGFKDACHLQVLLSQVVVLQSAGAQR